MTFEEWLKTNHPESYNEDWRDMAKKAVIGATIAGAGFGAYKLAQKPFLAAKEKLKQASQHNIELDRMIKTGDGGRER
jgi:hypothetical protein